MTDPLFFVNEGAFRDSIAADLTFTESAGAFISLLEDIIAITEKPMLAYEGIYYVEVDGQHRELASILFAQDGIDRDLRRRLMIVLGRCDLFSHSSGEDVTVQVEQDGQERSVESRAMKVALEQGLKTGAYVGLASRGEDGLLPGVALLAAKGEERVEAFLITVPREIAFTYRRAIAVLKPDEDGFWALSSRAFPQLLLASELNFRHFSDGYASVLAVVCDHLSFLNDEFLLLAFERNWDYGSIIAGARISLSDESPNTKANRRAMRQRQVRLGNKGVFCTLHTKLTPTKGRIHFHPPIEDLSGGRIIVGIFTDHLDT